MARTSPPPLMVWVLVGLLTLAALGAIAWGAFLVFASRQADSYRPSGLAGSLKRGSLDSALLLRNLAGMPDEQVLEYALATGKTETGFAIVALSDELGDPERASALITLAQYDAITSDSAQAAACYQALVNLAVLSADFHDYQKSNLLLQAGDGLNSLGQTLLAEEAFDRVGELARRSPTLPAVARVQLLDTLAGKYTSLERWSKAVDSSHSAGEVGDPGDLEPVNAALPAVAPAWDDDPAWIEVQARNGDRIRAAVALITALETKATDAVEPKRLALETALLAEDQAQDAFFAAARPRVSGTGARLALFQQRADWLDLKRRVAAGGYGMRLAPGWERSVQEIESALRSAQEDRFSLRLELAALLPDPLAARQATVDILIEELELGRLGLYPGAPERGLAGDLTAAIGDRVSLRRDRTLFVVPATRNGGTDIGFAFATADELLRE